MTEPRDVLIAALRSVDERIVAAHPEDAVELLEGEVEKGRGDYADAILAAMPDHTLVSIAELERLRAALEWIAEKADSFCPDCDDAVPPMPECLNSIHVISVKARAVRSDTAP